MIPERPSPEHQLDQHTVRVEHEDGSVTFETEYRWLHMSHVLSPEESLNRLNEEEEAYAEDAKRNEANKAKVKELTKHHDPAVAFLAAQLLTKL